MASPTSFPPAAAPSDFEQLVFKLPRVPVVEAAEWLGALPAAQAARALIQLNPDSGRLIVDALPEAKRQGVLEALPAEVRAQWIVNQGYPEDSVGRLMGPPVGRVPDTMLVEEAIEELRRQLTTFIITYLYAVDAAGRLTGVVVLRDLFFAAKGTPLAAIMIKPPFFLTPGLSPLDAVRQVVTRHYPAYPVCNSDGVLVGVLRAQSLFEKQAFLISAQAGRMVGVNAQEGLATSWIQSIRFRQPWLIVNLLLSLISAFVIAFFQSTIRELVILAVFLPVIASQARSSGSQAMAITIRAFTTGEWDNILVRRVVMKEMLLGVLNGLPVSILVGVLIYFQVQTTFAHPGWLGALNSFSLLAGCAAAGAFGVLVPLFIKRLGSDPAMASNILFTTLASVFCQAICLSLVRWVLL